MEDITRNKLADMLGCSTGLVMKYERRFADWLTTPAGEKGTPIAKVFTPEDVRTLATIHTMRQDGISYDAIADQLDAALASGAYDVVMEDADEGPEERPSYSGEGSLALAQVTLLIRSELEEVRAELKEERAARLDAEVRAARLEAQLEERSKPWWKRLTGG